VPPLNHRTRQLSVGLLKTSLVETQGSEESGLVVKLVVTSPEILMSRHFVFGSITAKYLVVAASVCLTE
jgi:hypothetical protein